MLKEFHSARAAVTSVLAILSVFDVTHIHAHTHSFTLAPKHFNTLTQQGRAYEWLCVCTAEHLMPAICSAFYMFYVLYVYCVCSRVYRRSETQGLLANKERTQLFRKRHDGLCVVDTSPCTLLVYGYCFNDHQMDAGQGGCSVENVCVLAGYTASATTTTTTTPRGGANGKGPTNCARGDQIKIETERTKTFQQPHHKCL